MTQQNQKHYAKKHEEKEILMEEEFRERLLKEAKEGRLTCSKAFLIGKESGKEPQQTGVYLDLLEIRIVECQLGLFGFTPEKRKVKTGEIIDPIRQLIEEGREDSRLSLTKTDLMADAIISW